MSINKVIIVGNLGNDPEVRYTTNGDQVASISVATTEYWKDRNTGERQEQTEWHRISIFGRTAETAGQYLKKGSQVYVEGRLRTRKYTGKDGIERYATDIICDNLQMLGKREDGGQRQEPAPQQHAQPRPAGRNSYADAKNGRGNPGYTMTQDNEDIPF